ncbi:MAG: phosphatidylglycerophosphatase A, partial [Gammaproteobacteria bacterium]|nr:phosphatidylglycerophosphatase A [Gammaproteobacteria bacterium]
MKDYSQPNRKIPLSYLKNPVHLLSLGFGSGLSPKAPGTMGTLAAVPLYLLLATLDLQWYLLLTLLLSLLGIWFCAYTSAALKVHDHPGIVIDEFAGFLITMIAVPLNMYTLILGFILFRLFDIIKPWPIGWLDRKVHGG